ncbi:site-specific DNA-methyltransferase [Cereibacter sp. SYSU M97828]|nr:site-specific DNA-methyltransferase [Cereibacter flavus]
MNIPVNMEIRPHPRIELDKGEIHIGDAEDILRNMPEASVQCIVTSPPYWGLRDYDSSAQIGAEPGLKEYIDRLVAVFRECRRVLRSDGVMWLNIGDGYTSGGRKSRAPDRKNPKREMSGRPSVPPGLKPKDLLGLPWRVAFALQDDGWYLRSDVIWNKPNAMPESVKDRPVRSHEYVFMLTKGEKYFYDRDRVREDNGRQCRSVWNVCTRPSRSGHPAPFPEDLISPCILSSSRKGDIVLDPFFGSGTVGVLCQKTERHFLGIELNESYAIAASNRISDASSLIAGKPLDI